MASKEKILVVDDEEVTRDILSRYMEHMGYSEVAKAADSEAALDIIKKTGFALVITDIHMPGENGLWLLNRLKKYCPDTRVIMVTASDDLRDAILSLNQGADRYLVKPLNIEEVQHAVESSLERRRLIMENREYQKNLEKKVEFRTVELKKSLHELDSANKIIKTAYIETVYRLTVTSEYRDEETGSHIKRIGYYADLLARELGFSAEKAEIFSRAAPMHDLGKVGIPDNILRKKDSLTPGEYKIMKTHTTIGAQILKGSSSEYLKVAKVIALTHHENWDGTGYPAGLKGKDIPVEGAIVHLADVYDALRSKRPYKLGIDHEKTCRIINHGDVKTKPSHFSPDLLQVFNKTEAKFARIFEKKL
jgi:putative two-component system response regulator